MSLYARDTEVSPDRSRAEIEKTVMRYGATDFVYGTKQDMAMIGFRMANRQVRFVVPFPSLAEFETGPSGRLRTELQRQQAWEQSVRQKWRALALAIKAKLEVVDSGITTFQREFLDYIVLPGGKTVGETILPSIEEAYRTGKILPLLEFKG